MTTFFLFCLGLIFGSFLSALTWRSLKGISIAKGRSMCPHCKHTLAWYDNIPLLSFLILNGKCRYCRKNISFRYPLIELTTALGFVGILMWWGKILVHLSWLIPFGIIGLGFILFLFCVTVAIVVTDLEEQIIPDEFVFGAFITSLFLLLLSPAADIWVRLACAFASASFLLFLNLITKGRGMGLGDVKLVIVPALLLGFPLTVVWFLVSFILGAVVGLVLILFRKSTFKARIPFGPFLLIGFWITLFCGNFLIQYLMPGIF